MNDEVTMACQLYICNLGGLWSAAELAKTGGEEREV